MHKHQTDGGSVYKRKDGRWVGSAYLHEANRATRRIYAYGHTRKDARDKLHEALDRHERGYHARQGGRLADYIDRWLLHVAATRHPLTYVQYESLCRLYLKPGLGDITLTKLSVNDLRVHFDDQHRVSITPRTIEKQRTVLSAILSYAQDEGLVDRNVARAIKLPKSRPKPIHPWTTEQARVFLASTTHSRYHDIFLLLLLYGLRRGEAMGLRWGDIDFQQNLIHIRSQVVAINGRLSIQPLKTEASRRDLPLVSSVSVMLHSRLLKHPNRPSNDALVFPTRNGTPIDPDRAREELHRLSERLGLPKISLHTMRHTAATMLKDAGVPVRDVQLILGHSNIITTLQIYEHADINTERNDIMKVEKMLS